MENGHLKFCQSDERLNRIKNSLGFPRRTLSYVYSELADPSKIDLAVLFQKSVYGYLYLKKHNFQALGQGFNLDPSMKLNGLRESLLKTSFGWWLRHRNIDFVQRNNQLLKESISYFCEELLLPEEKIVFLDHHLAHAYSVVPNLKRDKPTLIFTLDCVGDWKCASVNIFDGTEMRVISTRHHRNSLGYYYSTTTGILGMKMGEHEYKLMGLAPYASLRYVEPILNELRKLLWIDSNGEWKSKPNPVALQDELERVFRFKRFDAVAGAIQALTEERIQEWVRFWIDKTSIRDIAVAGGVFMNVKASQKLKELPMVHSLFVMPSAGDESTAIGAAVYGTIKLGLDVTPIRHLYLGRSYSSKEVQNAVAASGITEVACVEDCDNDYLAALLSRNKIIAGCVGPMEFGARALGNRSILANPSSWANVDLINRAIKNRDFWMPFCPSILDTDVARYIQDYEKIEAPFMCITFNGTEEAKLDLAATIHPRDGTLRPQVVTREANPDYYDLISSFKKQTGIGGILNTSFNLHGEPNVCSPEDAIRTFLKSGLEYLVLGDVLLTKKKSALKNAA
jgi:carbamoyltransferase